MVLWVIFSLSIAVVLGYLLFAPFYIEINSVIGLYGIRFHHLATARLHIKDHSLKVDFRIAGWKKQIDLLTTLTSGNQKKKPVKKKTNSKGFPLQMAQKVIKSFKVNCCYLNIDTGNRQLNGLLYPGFYWLGKYWDKPIGINFLNENEVILEIENNFANVLKIIIYTFKIKRSWRT
jgi:hypothetical protein